MPSADLPRLGQRSRKLGAGQNSVSSLHTAKALTTYLPPVICLTCIKVLHITGPQNLVLVLPVSTVHARM